MNRLQLLSVFFLGTLLFFGCQKWDEPKFKAETWTPPTGTLETYFWTIDNHPQYKLGCVLWKHRDRNTGAGNQQPDSIVNRLANSTLRFIRAVVVSSDEGGNYYKSMVVQDSTGGVELELDMTGLYTKYPVGQQVIIALNGLCVGDYNSLPQIGWIYKDGIGRINSQFIDSYIIRDGQATLANVPKPLTNNEIDFGGPKDVNKLVRLENVRFEPLAINKPFAFNDATTDWKVYVPLANGTTDSVVVRTSNYAKFRNTIIQNKTYNLTGILTVFGKNNTTNKYNYQLMIRTEEDIRVISD